MEDRLDEPSSKRPRVETASSSSSLDPIEVKILLTDKTLPTIAANTKPVSEVLMLSIPRSSDGASATSASHAHTSVSAFRAKVVAQWNTGRSLVTIDRAVAMDCEGVDWLVWDSDFSDYVPLTSERQLIQLVCRHPLLTTLRVELESRHRHHTTPISKSHDSTVMTREGTFLGTAAMIRLPTHHVAAHTVCTDTNNNDVLASVGHRVQIFLIRHGESLANVDPSIYKSTPDHAISLTAAGQNMAERAGAFLKEHLGRQYGSKSNLAHHVRMLVSPYERTRQTARAILKELNLTATSTGPAEKWVDSVKELPFLAEQDFGLCEGDGASAKAKCSEELERITLQRNFRGKFWSRFPQGESPFDVAVRMAGVSTEIMSGCTTRTASRSEIKTYIVVSHGLTIRAFIAAWCCKSPEWVADSVNPPNCSIQLVQDTVLAGYLFGGFERGKEVDASSIEMQSDPRQDAWNEFL